MATSRKSDSVTLALGDAIGTQLKSVFTAAGHGTGKVWSTNPPSNVEYPWATYDIREMPSEMAGTKDTEPVRAVATVRIFSDDELVVRQLGRDAQETLIDRDNPPSINGFKLFWHDLVFHMPLNDVRPDAPNVYGRAIEIAYHLEIE